MLRSSTCREEIWWSQAGSNRRPLECHSENIAVRQFSLSYSKSLKPLSFLVFLLTVLPREFPGIAVWCYPGASQHPPGSTEEGLEWNLSGSASGSSTA